MGKGSLHDAIKLHLRHLRALERILGKRITDHVLLRPLLEPLNKLVIDALLDINPAAGTAALAVVEKDAKIHPRDGIIDIRVLEDNVGRLAPQLERDLLEVGAGGHLEDLAADDRRAGEGDLVDVHVRGDGRAGRLAEAGDDVHDAWWEAGLLDELGSDEATERSLFGSLKHDGVAACDGRADLPRPHEQGEVPRDNLAADANGLLADVVEGVRGGVDGLALNLVGPTAVVAQAAGAHADVDLGHVDGLAVVERLDGGEEVEVLLEQLREAVQQLAAVLRRLLPPGALEGLAGGGDGDVDILLGGLLDGADDLFVGGVDDLEGLAVDGLDELVVDEAGDGLSAPHSLHARVINDQHYTYRPVGCSYLPECGVSSVMLSAMMTVRVHFQWGISGISRKSSCFWFTQYRRR